MTKKQKRNRANTARQRANNPKAPKVRSVDYGAGNKTYINIGDDGSMNTMTGLNDEQFQAAIDTDFDDRILIAGVELLRPPTNRDNGTYGYWHPATGTEYVTKREDVAAVLEVFLGAIMLNETPYSVAVIGPWLKANEPKAAKWITKDLVSSIAARFQS